MKDKIIEKYNACSKVDKAIFKDFLEDFIKVGRPKIEKPKDFSDELLQDEFQRLKQVMGQEFQKIPEINSNPEIFKQAYMEFIFEFRLSLYGNEDRESIYDYISYPTYKIKDFNEEILDYLSNKRISDLEYIWVKRKEFLQSLNKIGFIVLANKKSDFYKGLKETGEEFLNEENNPFIDVVQENIERSTEIYGEELVEKSLNELRSLDIKMDSVRCKIKDIEELYMSINRGKSFETKTEFKNGKLFYKSQEIKFKEDEIPSKILNILFSKDKSEGISLDELFNEIHEKDYQHRNEKDKARMEKIRSCISGLRRRLKKETKEVDNKFLEIKKITLYRLI